MTKAVRRWNSSGLSSDFGTNFGVAPTEPTKKTKTHNKSFFINNLA
jgi:hypothetical protein